MSEIATASREQSDGIQQVNEAIRQMDQATQQNAALVEQASASTESMQIQAQQLANAVSAFKVDHSSIVDKGRLAIARAAASVKTIDRWHPALLIPTAPRASVQRRRSTASETMAEFEQF